MPDPINDFTDYMGQPPQQQWGPLRPPGGYQQPTWQGSSPWQESSSSWSTMAGRYGGNFGSVLGGIADRYAPQESLGMWAVPVGQGRSLIAQGRNANTQQSIQSAQQSSVAGLRERIEDSLRAQGVKGDPVDIADAAKVMSGQWGVQRAMGGLLTARGAQALVGALAGSHNGFNPSSREVVGLQKAMDGYYGFGAGRTIDYSRTLGRGQDELALLTSETRRRMDPGSLNREREKASAELIAFNKDTLGAAVGAHGVSAGEWSGVLDSGENLDDALTRLSGGDHKKATKLRSAVSDAQKKAFGMATPGVDAVLNTRLMGKNKELGEVMGNAQAMGFTGSLSQLVEELEQSFGADSLDTSKMQALTQRMRGISQSTGIMMNELVALTKNIETGTNGNNLTHTQGVGILARATLGTGSGMGFTKNEQRIMQETISSGLANPMKNASGQTLMAMKHLDKEGYDAYMAIAGKDPVKAAAYMAERAISTGTKEFKDVYTAQVMGFNDIVAGTISAKQTAATRAAVAYNSKETSAADRAAAKTELDKHGGVTYSKDGKATVSSGVLDVNKAAAADAMQRLHGVGLGTAITDLGKALLPGGTAAEQAAAGATLASQYNKAPNVDRSLRMASNLVMQATGKQIDMNADVGAHLPGITTEGRRVYGEQYSNLVDTVAVSAQSEELQARKEVAAQAAALDKNRSSAMDIIQRTLRGASTEDGLSAVKSLLGTTGLDPDAQKAMGSVLAMKDEDRNKVLTALSTDAGIMADLEIAQGLPDADASKQGQIQTLTAAQKANRLNLSGLAQGDLDALTRGGFGNFAEAATKANMGKNEFMRLQGTLVIEGLKNADGTAAPGVTGQLSGQGSEGRGKTL